jgi:hypothetical protein
MFEEKRFTSERDGFEGNSDLYQPDGEREYGALQMKIFMDYCYFIEKLWLDWKHYYIRFFH